MPRIGGDAAPYIPRADEDDARETLALLERGAELQRELDELRQGSV